MNKDLFIKTLNQKNNKFAQLTSKLSLQTADSARILQKYVLSQSPNKLKLLQNGNYAFMQLINKKKNKISPGVIVAPKFYVTAQKKRRTNHSQKNGQDGFDMLDALQCGEVLIASSAIKHHYSTQQRKTSPQTLVKRVQLRNSKDFKNLQKCLFPPASLQKDNAPKLVTKIQMFKTHTQVNTNQISVKSTNFLQRQDSERDSPSIMRKSSNVQDKKMKQFARQTKLNLEKRKNVEIQLEQQRSKQLQQRKNLSQSYSKPFNPPTNITAYSYIIYEPNFSTGCPKNKQSSKYVNSYKVHLSYNSRNCVEVASLTKIMTCLVGIQLCERFNLDSNKQEIHIGKFQSNIGGTSANISMGQIYTLQQLLYGLMLPSGNDASLAIAVWGGRLLLHSQKLKETITTYDACNLLKSSKFKKKQCYDRFLIQMNNKAKQIGLQKTNYANSHGLVNLMNKSCSYDIAVLCEYALANQKFQTIVNTKQYQCQIKYILQDKVSMRNSKKTVTSSKKLNTKAEQENDQEKQLQDEDLQQQSIDQIWGERSVKWQNTHLLLHEKPKLYTGIKTGITTAAGPCLASCIKTQDQRKFIIIVLGCKKLSYRFKETEILRKWIFKKQGLLKIKQPPINSKTKLSSYPQSDQQSQDY